MSSLSLSECCTLALQVIDGGSGELAEQDLSFLLVSPEGETLRAEEKQHRGDHQLTASQTGDYKLCLGNKFSFLSSRTVSLEVQVEREEGADDLAELSYVREERRDSQMDSQLRKIKAWLIEATRLQDQIRVTDRKDRKISEHNFERVNFLSACSLVLLLGSSLTQVILLRSLFEEKPKINLAWKRRANF